MNNNNNRTPSTLSTPPSSTANHSIADLRPNHLFTSHSPFGSLRSIVPITHYCRLSGNRLFTLKFELPAMLDLIELKTGIYLRIPNDFIYSSQADVLSLSHDLSLISNSDLLWLYRLRDMTAILPPSRSLYHSHCRINHIADSNIILTDDFIHLPLYLSSSDAHLHIYNVKSLKISFSVLLPSTILTSEHFTLLTDYITIEEDKYNDFSNCLNILLDRTTPPVIKTIIISQLAKYNISHGRNICPPSISLTQYYDDNGSLIKPLPADPYNLNHRTVFNIWRKRHGIPQIMTYLRSIQDEAFQAALSRFNDLQHR